MPMVVAYADEASFRLETPTPIHVRINLTACLNKETTLTM